MRRRLAQWLIVPYIYSRHSSQRFGRRRVSKATHHKRSRAAWTTIRLFRVGSEAEIARLTITERERRHRLRGEQPSTIAATPAVHWSWRRPQCVRSPVGTTSGIETTDDRLQYSFSEGLITAQILTPL